MNAIRSAYHTAMFADLADDVTLGAAFEVLNRLTMQTGSDKSAKAARRIAAEMAKRDERENRR